MKIFDITLALHDGMIVYPGDPVFKRRVLSSLDGGDSSEVSVIEMGSHTGTHIDAPAHMIKGGRRLDEIPLDILVGPARVVDLSGIDGHVDARHLEEIDWNGVDRVLLKTRNSARRDSAKEFDRDFCALTGFAAEFLAGKKIKLVGIDGPSVDRFKSGVHPAHIPLLTSGIVILEGLDLSQIQPGDYQLICAPLKIAVADGAPARVFLVL